jgi:hypothetical protein
MIVDSHIAELRSCQQLFHLASRPIALSSPAGDVLFEVAINFVVFGVAQDRVR